MMRGSAVCRSLNSIATGSSSRVGSIPLYARLRALSTQTNGASSSEKEREIRFHKARYNDYILKNQPDSALEHFLSLRPQATPQDKAQAYEELMSAFLEKGDTTNVHKMKSMLEEDKLPYNNKLHELVWRTHIKDGKVEAALQVFNKQKESGGRDVQLSTEQYITLIKELSKFGYATEAEKALDAMNKEGLNCGVEPYNAIIAHYKQKGSVDKVNAWFDKLKKTSSKPNEESYFYVISTLVESGGENVSNACQLYEEMNEKGIHHPQIGAKLVRGLLKQGDLLKTMPIFKKERNMAIDVNDYKTILAAMEEGKLPASYFKTIVDYLMESGLRDDSVYNTAKSVLLKNKNNFEKHEYFVLRNEVEELKYDENQKHLEAENPCKQQ